LEAQQVEGNLKFSNFAASWNTPTLMNFRPKVGVYEERTVGSL
jgi:hypothetical protein